MDDDLIARQRPGTHPGDDNRWPIVGPDLTIRLSPDESMQWRGAAEVSMLRYNRSLPDGGDYEHAWSLQETAEVLITNTRLLYRANTLTRKTGYLSGIRAGVASAIAGGPPRLSPHAYLGQVRFDWVVNVMLKLQRKFHLSFGMVMLTVIGARNLPMRLVLTFPLQPNGMTEPNVRGLASALVHGIAAHRRVVPADPETMPSGLVRWDIPGSRPVVPVGAPPAVLTPLAALTQAIDALGLPG
jgi:hypothetical protein